LFSGWWSGVTAGRAVVGRCRGDHRQPGRGPGGESPVKVGGIYEAKLLEGRCGQGGLVSLVADEDDVQVPAGDGGMPPRGRGVAAPFQRVAGQHDGAGDEAACAPLIVAADVDEQRATGLGAERLGRRWAVRQRGLAWASSSSTVFATRRWAMSGLLIGSCHPA
jgi:hypothetical protein